MIITVSIPLIPLIFEMWFWRLPEQTSYPEEKAKHKETHFLETWGDKKKAYFLLFCPAFCLHLHTSEVGLLKGWELVI